MHAGSSQTVKSLAWFTVGDGEAAKRNLGTSSAVMGEMEHGCSCPYSSPDSHVLCVKHWTASIGSDVVGSLRALGLADHCLACTVSIALSRDEHIKTEISHSTLVKCLHIRIVWYKRWPADDGTPVLRDILIYI